MNCPTTSGLVCSSAIHRTSSGCVEISSIIFNRVYAVGDTLVHL